MLLALGQTAVWSSLFYVFPALILQWETALGWSKVQLTGALTVALLTSALTSVWVGGLIDRGHGPMVLSAGAACGALLLLLVSRVEFLWQFYVLWGLMGVALAACLYEPCFMLVTRAYGSSAKRSIITITLIAGFASTISFPVAHVLGEAFDWRVVTLCFSAVALLIGVPALYTGAVILEKHAAQRQVAAVGSSQIDMLKNPVLLQLGLCFAFLAVVHGATLHHLLPVLNDRGLTPGAAVLIASLIGPMQVFGRLVMTLFQRRITHSFVAHCCFIFICLSMGLLFFAGRGFVVAVLFVILFGGSYGVVSIIRPVIARDILGDAGFGAKSGLLAFFYLIGAALSPYVGSLIWSLGGYNLMIPLLSVLSLVGLVVLHRVIAVVHNASNAI